MEAAQFMAYLIETATLEDLPFIVRGVRELVEFLRERTGELYFKPIRNRHDEAFEQWGRDLIENENLLLEIAWKEYSPVGFLAGSLEAPFLPYSKIQQTGIIESIWIESEYLGKGVTEALLQSAENWFRENGANFAELRFLKGNNESEQFWQNLGYISDRTTSRKTL
jgi:GNAT superfamily N-acetyltransferase